MNLILLGAPGSGKGTLAKNIAKEFKIPQISTGDILRANITFGTILGKKAKEYMDEGKLVPDELVIDLLKQRLLEEDCKNGYILDGFPRTVVQAKELEKFAKIDSVILIDLPFNVIEDRIVNRRLCENCGEIYNVSTYEKNTCKKCGAPLYQRDDDKLETVRNRLEVYERQTAPLINFYSDKIHKVNSIGSPEETYGLVKRFLENKEASFE